MHDDVNGCENHEQQHNDVNGCENHEQQHNDAKVMTGQVNGCAAT